MKTQGFLENGYGKRLEDISGEGCEFGRLLKQSFNLFTKQYVTDIKDMRYDIKELKKDFKEQIEKIDNNLSSKIDKLEESHNRKEVTLNELNTYRNKLMGGTAVLIFFLNIIIVPLMIKLTK